MKLYRPIGQAELELIQAADYSGFPPRLPEQPILYPVLSRRYAEEIARAWNTRDAASGYCGYVTRFNVDDEYVRRFPVRTVGARYHRELWVPADELPEFNRHIVGKIEVIRSFKGEIE